MKGLVAGETIWLPWKPLPVLASGHPAKAFFGKGYRLALDFIHVAEVSDGELAAGHVTHGRGQHGVIDAQQVGELGADPPTPRRGGCWRAGP